MPLTPLNTDQGGGLTSHAPQAIISKFLEDYWDPTKMPLYATPKKQIFFSHTIMPETAMRQVIHCDVDPSQIVDFEIGGRVQSHSQRVVIHAYISDSDALRESVTSDVAEEIAIYLRNFISDNRETLQSKGIDWMEIEGDGWAPNPEDRETQHYYLYVRINYYTRNDEVVLMGIPVFQKEIYQPETYQTD